MHLTKVERHYDTLFSNTVTEINRFVSDIYTYAVQDAKAYAKEKSKEFKSTRGRNQFFIVTYFNERLNEWMYITTYKTGYEE